MPTAPGMPPAPDRVLITGGTARNVMSMTGNCLDCDNMDNQLSCVLSQTAIYDVAKNSISPAPALVQIPRYGHTQTVMPDGNVVIIGGYTRNNKQVFAVAVPEVWNPVRKAPAAPDTDDPAFLDLPGQKLKRDPGTQFYCANGGNPMTPAVSCGTPGRPLPMNGCM
jgi:hypothetical protein